MNKNVYGYIRVSTKDQHVDRQKIALEEFGVSGENIFMDRMSGKDFERPAWKQLMDSLQPDDLLVVKSVDRIGRNYKEMTEQWRTITHKKQADIYVLEMPILDTRGKRDLMGTLVADIVLVIMSFFAQSEREAIRQRQAEGIAAAKARGVRFGGMPLEPPIEFALVHDKWKRGEISARKAGQMLGVSHHTFIKWHKKTGNESMLPVSKP